MRNRIIAGSSFGMIPAECPADSNGTINAVRTAHSYGRFVFMARARGSHRDAPGAWLTEACLTKSRDAIKMLSVKKGPAFSPNFIAESAEDLKDVVRVAAALTDYTL
jgi:predicted Rossmann fold nucleotide-binding protein DprA/Smf involved in DNA uptake